MTATPLGMEIRRVREVERRLSQEEVAFRAGITQTALSKIERGVTKKPGKPRIIAIAEAMEWPADPLLILADYAPTAATIPTSAGATQAQSASAKAKVRTLRDKFHDTRVLTALSKSGALSDEDINTLLEIFDQIPE